jgi:SNF2 family DNA or RNA helicase
VWAFKANRTRRSAGADVNLLLDFQNLGATFLAERNRAYLADEMRLGKTIQAITAVNRLKLGSAHVTAPASAVPNWWRLIDQWADHPRAWSVCSDAKPAGRLPEAMVHILDEAHREKTPGATRTVALLGPDSPAMRAPYFWCLSGTPCPNSVWELWTILAAWGVTKLSRMAFLDRYCSWREGTYGPIIMKTKRVAELRALLAPIMLRRMQASVLADYKAPIWSEISLALHDGDRPAKPTDVALELSADDEEKWSRQRRLVGEAKAPVLARFLAEELELDQTGKIVIMAYHREVMNILECGLLKFGVVQLHGESRDRGAPVARFQTDPTCRVFIGNDAAKEAIDLTAASNLVFAEMSTVPGDNWQKSQRIQGITQSKPVLIRCASLAGSLDEVITRIHTRKTRALDPVFAKENHLADPAHRSLQLPGAGRVDDQATGPDRDAWRLAA